MNRFATLTALALTAVLLVPSSPATAAPGLAIPVSGAGSGLTFVGTFSLQRFVSSTTGIDAVGTLTGTVTNVTGQAVSIVQTIALPTSIGTTTCDILHLDLGPLAIDLLGLQVDLSRIVLDITAQAGAGNLLGNLLCAVAGLLDNPSGLARLLNQILAILG